MTTFDWLVFAVSLALWSVSLVRLVSGEVRRRGSNPDPTYPKPPAPPNPPWREVGRNVRPYREQSPPTYPNPPRALR